MTATVESNAAKEKRIYVAEQGGRRAYHPALNAGGLWV